MKSEVARSFKYTNPCPNHLCMATPNSLSVGYMVTILWLRKEGGGNMDPSLLIQKVSFLQKTRLNLHTTPKRNNIEIYFEVWCANRSRPNACKTIPSGFKIWNSDNTMPGIIIAKMSHIAMFKALQPCTRRQLVKILPKFAGLIAKQSKWSASEIHW